MTATVLDLKDIDPTRIHEVGGKAAGLGALSRLDGVQVPPGFCLTTAAYARAAAPTIDGPRVLPEDVAHAVRRALARHGPREAYAVRSSATAEDLPGASAAGQQDSALNVRGEAAVLAQIQRCWASLHSARAVAYRARQGAPPPPVQMAVVVQRMVAPEAAGVLFTADPLSGHRRICVIEAVYGLAEPLVSGRAPADRFRVRDGQVLEAVIATKARATVASPGGGTAEEDVAPARQAQPALSLAQIQRLEALGRQIEAHFGAPQDIEWCLVGDTFQIVQSRPITTLYPIPDAGQPGGRVFLSVGHQQMMTDAMRPLGLSVFQMTAARPMVAAGGRLFVDPTQQLAAPASRQALLAMMRRAEPLIGDALQTLLDRGDLIATAPAGPPAPAAAPPPPPAPDPAIVATLIQRDQEALDRLEPRVAAASGLALLDLIAEDVAALRQSLTDPTRMAAIMAGFSAANALNDTLLAWLGEPSAADALSLSAPNNVSAELGLALLDVADVIRPHAEVVAWLDRAEDAAGFWEGLAALPGGAAAAEALRGWLDRYGMRCPGEIDLTRPRWRERPTMLVPLLLHHVRRAAPGAGRRRFAQGQAQAQATADALLARLRALPDGEQKAAEAARWIQQLRDFCGYREHPKYTIVRRFFVYRTALLQEARRLVAQGLLPEEDDWTYLTLAELRAAVAEGAVSAALLNQRKAAHEAHQRLTPPRVITSEGEVVVGSYRRADPPAGALLGLGVSAGVVEGRAAVLLDMAEARLEPGDILVTRFTDPGWTPLFTAIAGLVTEVGGLTSHGVVIAREYGLPAVVGVAQATARIRHGQRIRVHGAAGTVEILG